MDNSPLRSDNRLSSEFTIEQDPVPQNVHEIEARVGMLTEAGVDTGVLATCSISETELDLAAPNSFNSPREQGVVTPIQPGSPIYSPATSEEMDYLYHTPPPPPAFTQPPSPPRPEPRRPLFGNIFPPEPEQGSEVEHGSENESYLYRECPPRLLSPLEPQHSIRQPVFWTTPSASNNHHFYPFEGVPRKPLTSIAGSSRCLWPPDSTFLTMSSTFKERAFQHRRIGLEDSNVEGPRSLSRSTTPTLLSSTTGVTSSDNIMCSQKNHIRSEDFRDTGDCMQELQPRRKARRVMDGGPYFKERNHRLVAGHVRKLIQEAVEDGVGELDLSNLELTDLPSEICDLNFAIVYNERGSFSLSNNRLKLFLSSNQFSTVPMDVFALHNLSVLSLRNNSIEVIPPEIGLLHNLVELSIGGNLLKVLPSQIALLPKLHILTVHPNPFMPTPDPDGNLGSVNHNDNQVGPPAFGAHNGNATVASMVSVQHNVTNQNEQAQQSMQTSLISPPVSPPTLQSEDVDMTPPPEQGGANNESLSLNILESEAMGSGAIIEETQLTRASSSQSSTLTPINIGGSRPHITTSLTTSEVNRGELPPHLTTRSRFPTLLILAGNALLNYMESQGITTTVKKGQTLDVERPRKDSKVSMSEDEWEESPQINNINHEQLWQMDKNQGAERNYSSLAVEPQPQKKRYIFREEIIKSHLTPYLFDHFKRAWANNLCAGCQRRFWKPCKIVVVWQDILGQSLVPIEWRGCGIRGCLGVPASMWLSRNPVLPSSELSSPVSNSMSVVASPSNSGSMVPVLVDETNLPPIT